MNCRLLAPYCSFAAGITAPPPPGPQCGRNPSSRSQTVPDHPAYFGLHEQNYARGGEIPSDDFQGGVNLREVGSRPEDREWSQGPQNDGHDLYGVSLA